MINNTKIIFCGRISLLYELSSYLNFVKRGKKPIYEIKYTRCNRKEGVKECAFLAYVIFIHSFIHCRHLYSASSSGATQKRSQPQRGRIMLFSLLSKHRIRKP